MATAEVMRMITFLVFLIPGADCLVLVTVSYSIPISWISILWTKTKCTCIAAVGHQTKLIVQ